MEKQIQAEPVLTMTGIYKAFAGVQALAGVDFELLPGEIHALVGENGAGKSTLIKVMTGVHRPDRGRIELQGTAIDISDPLAAQQHGIAAIYQEASLFPDLDVAENILMGRQPLGAAGLVNWGQMYEEAEKPLKALGLDLDPRTPVRGLTIAQMQMLEIAKALTANARVLIMDEPTSVLTQREVEDLFRITRQLRDSGTSIVFISHRLEEVFELVDRVTVLRDGQLIGTRAVDEVSHDDLIRMMVGRTLDTLFPKVDVQQGEVVLRVEGLGREGLFENVSFELHQGEILGMAGLVGARRTDVAKAIFGIEPADYGTIWIDGREIDIRTPNDAMASGIAYVPEDRQGAGLIAIMDVTRNITLPILHELTHMGWVDQGAEAAKAFDYSAQLDVRAAGLWQRVQELSGGNQQKVVLAKWLASRPKILILDEPTRGIDVGTKAAVHQLMGELATQGLAVLMISSELPEILGMSDRVVVMCEGRMTGHFSRAEATQESIIKAATARTTERTVQAITTSETG